MKLLIFSDSHKRLYNAISIIKKLENRIDAVVHLGDMVKDALQLNALFNHLPFHFVSGNCDLGCGFGNDFPSELLLNIYNVKILITHGHKYKVKVDITPLSYVAEDRGASVALFGHTHHPVIAELGNVILFNPGSITAPRYGTKPSYGVLEITPEGKVNPGIVSL